MQLAGRMIMLTNRTVLSAIKDEAKRTAKDNKATCVPHLREFKERLRASGFCEPYLTDSGIHAECGYFVVTDCNGWAIELCASSTVLPSHTK